MLSSLTEILMLSCSSPGISERSISVAFLSTISTVGVSTKASSRLAVSRVFPGLGRDYRLIPPPQKSSKMTLMFRCLRANYLNGSNLGILTTSLCRIVLFSLLSVIHLFRTNQPDPSSYRQKNTDRSNPIINPVPVVPLALKLTSVV